MELPLAPKAVPRGDLICMWLVFLPGFIPCSRSLKGCVAVMKADYEPLVSLLAAQPLPLLRTPSHSTRHMAVGLPLCLLLLCVLGACTLVYTLTQRSVAKPHVCISNRKHVINQDCDGTTCIRELHAPSRLRHSCAPDVIKVYT